MSENNVRNFLLFDHEYVRIRTLMSTLLKADFERIIFKLEATWILVNIFFAENEILKEINGERYEISKILKIIIDSVILTTS